jgi:hypothetical protein
MQRINTTIVAIDALYFSRPAEQYKAFRIKRELNKAYCGYFIRENDTTGQGEWIATGTYKNRSRYKLFFPVNVWSN